MGFLQQYWHDLDSFPFWKDPQSYLSSPTAEDMNKKLACRRAPTKVRNVAGWITVFCVFLRDPQVIPIFWCLTHNFGCWNPPLLWFCHDFCGGNSAFLLFQPITWGGSSFSWSFFWAPSAASWAPPGWDANWRLGGLVGFGPRASGDQA